MRIRDHDARLRAQAERGLLEVGDVEDRLEVRLVVVDSAPQGPARELQPHRLLHAGPGRPRVVDRVVHQRGREGALPPLAFLAEEEWVEDRLRGHRARVGDDHPGRGPERLGHDRGVERLLQALDVDHLV